ncbi:MAG TPA: hypothetical protein PLI51_02335 [bacterium]|nr:hypothetical protein [bacterium]HPQ65553.1 hypothetical protein [bacterium]
MIEIDCCQNGCEGIFSFELGALPGPEKPVCPECGATLELGRGEIEDLNLLFDLVGAIRRAAPILSRTAVGVELAGAKVLLPYRLLLSRLTTELAVEGAGGKRVFRVLPDTVGPLSGEAGAQLDGGRREC